MRAMQPCLAIRGTEQRRKGNRQQVTSSDAAQLFQITIGKNRMRQLQRVAVVGSLFQDVALGPDKADQRHHHLFADRINRRIRDLREKLLEVIEQRLRPVRQARQRRIGSHRAHRLLSRGRHRLKNHAQIFVGISKRPLAAENRAVIDAVNPRRLRKLIERDLLLLQPLLVRLPLRQALLHLLVGNDPAANRIYQKHFSRLQAALGLDVFRINLQNTRL